jgi:hypothetical protein
MGMRAQQPCEPLAVPVLVAAGLSVTGRPEVAGRVIVPAHAVKTAAEIALQHIDNSQKAATASRSRLAVVSAEWIKVSGTVCGYGSDRNDWPEENCP